MPTRVAIVGAGIAGLACADHLSPHVKDIVLFDKGRRPGGRLTSVEINEFSWDIGAPCLVAHTPQFRVSRGDLDGTCATIRMRL